MGFSLQCLLLVGSTGSRHMGFSRCGRRAQELRHMGFICSIACGIFPDRIEPMSLALAGRFLSTCSLYHWASPPILMWKRKVSSFSWGVVGSSPGETRCYGDFPKPLEEKGVFEMESVAKKCSKIFGLEILIIFEIQLAFIFSYFWIFLSFILLENARSLNILFKNIRWLFFFFLQSWAKW